MKETPINKTDSSIRKVWLPKTLAYILREWKKAQDELRGFLGCGAFSVTSIRIMTW